MGRRLRRPGRNDTVRAVRSPGAGPSVSLGDQTVLHETGPRTRGGCIRRGRARARGLRGWCAPARGAHASTGGGGGLSARVLLITKNKKNSRGEGSGGGLFSVR